MTLNPIVLNFLDDDFAKKVVHIRTGLHGLKLMGEIPEIQYKFDLLGPGEIVCDCDFENL